MWRLAALTALAQLDLKLQHDSAKVFLPEPDEADAAMVLVAASAELEIVE